MKYQLCILRTLHAGEKGEILEARAIKMRSAYEIWVGKLKDHFEEMVMDGK